MKQLKSSTSQSKLPVQLNAFWLLFVINGVQVGVGIAGVQRLIYKMAGHDAWISVIVAGFAAHIAGWVMVKTLLRYDSKDLYEIHDDVYGKWLAKALNILYSFYLAFFCLTILRGYAEIVQTWLFPELSLWVLNALMLLLVVYGILGGIRVIVGFCFFSVLYTLWQVALLYFPLTYANWSHLLPIMNKSVADIVKGSLYMSYSMLGFEFIYFIGPYIREKDKMNRYTQLGLLATTTLYLAVMVVTLVYFDGNQLLRTTWPTLTMMKIIEFPFIERFEFISVSMWMLLVLDNLLLMMWAAARGMQHVFQTKKNTALYFYCAFIFFVSMFYKTRGEINSITTMVGTVGGYVAFVYPFLLYGLVWLKKKGAKSH